MCARHLVCVIGLVVPVSFASGQSINIDFGTDPGVPADTYGAAGLPGVWNAVNFVSEFPPPNVFDPVALVGLDGKPTSATVAAGMTFGTIGPLFPFEGPEGDDELLLADGLFGHSPDISQFLLLAGLENGSYRVVTYTWVWPSDSYGMVVFFNQGGVPEPVQIISGPWQGALNFGTTHGVRNVEVTDGTLTLELVGAGPGSFFNGNNLIQGMQLWKVDAPADCAADLTGHGVVDGLDLGILLANWSIPPTAPGCGPTAGDCPSDINQDGFVNGLDLGILLANWGDCPGGPVECGGPGPRLGDCYSPHAGGGCREAACCDAVCALDSFCCESEWDATCVGLANLNGACPQAVHHNCGNPDSGSCFAAKDTLMGCADKACCGAVCAVDPYCCDFTWDTKCVEEAQALCTR